MDNEKDNVVTGEILSSDDDRKQQDNTNFHDDFYSQFQVRRIKTWHILLVIGIILFIIGLAIYVFIKYIEFFLIIILIVFVLRFAKGLIK